MNRTPSEKKSRRPYHKPQLEQVQLAIPEAVLSHCKSPVTGGGKNYPDCHAYTSSCKYTFGS